jgi:eukaryotic-like serine/threonine-protein kinase
LSLTETRLGAYEILGPLGAGGMGEVYRARDPRLAREVAIKVLPKELFESEERTQRFEREAKLLASLNHPNVAAIYSFEEIPPSPSSLSRHVLVMELVEGKTLRAHLKAGDLSPRAILDVAAQIARGLAAAHERGIVHRDLKPENVMLSKEGRVKILDFGLAKLSGRAPSAEEISSAGTRSLLTEAGAVMGTVGYMSPEQVRGEPLDARSDIFSFGTILYELLAGKNPFRAATSAETMTAILRHEPPSLSEPPLSTSPSLALIVARCMEKRREKRFQSAEDLAFALETSSGSSFPARKAAAGPGTGPRGRWRIAGACLASLLVGVSAAFLFFRGATHTVPAPPIRFSFAPPEGGSFFFQLEANTIAISPDGLKIAFVSVDTKGVRRIWLRTLSVLEARPLPGTDGATSIFWSPDGSSLGFFAERKLKRLDLASGAPVSICEDPGAGGKAGTWGRSDILFSGVQGDAIYRVSSAGGTPVPILKPDTSRGEGRVVWPWFLPDGEKFLYLLRRIDGEDLMIAEPGQSPRVVMPAASMVQYSDPGYLLFTRESTLLGQRFDARAGRLSGRPFSVAEHVRYFMSTGAASFATSSGGTLALQPQGDVHRLVWFDRTGAELGTIGKPAKDLGVFIPSDGRPALFDRASADRGTFDVWSYDVERNVETRVTSAPDSAFSARWLPGGKDIVYSTVRGSNPRLVRREMATGKEHELLPAGGFQVAKDVSPDGRTLLYFERPDRGSFDMWALRLSGDARPRHVLEGAHLTDDARFSPDGRFLAFISSESGQPEAYALPFPGPGEKTRVSTEGARIVRWSRDGRALLFLSSDRRLMSVPVHTTPTLQLGTPTPLFSLKGRSSWLDFDVSREGDRFLAVVPEVVADERPLDVVVNWTSGAGN